MKKIVPILFFCIVATFKLFAAVPPVISSFAPSNGPVGAVVIVTGSGFNVTAANNIVFFGVVKATVTAATATSLTVIVPNSTTYAPISVLNTSTGLLAYSSKPFNTVFYTNNTLSASNFSPSIDITPITDPPVVTIGDLDGDGKPDIVTVDYNHGIAIVYRNTSNTGNIVASSFVKQTIPLSYGVNSLPITANLVDLDGDGKLDLIVGDQDNNIVSVFRNTSVNGTISFGAEQQFATGVAPSMVASGDINKDGKTDLVVANSGANSKPSTANSISILQNTSVVGSISFAATVVIPTSNISYNTTTIALSDLDGDGNLDIIAGNFASNTISVFRNLGNSNTITASLFAAKKDISTGIGPNINVADIDGDGKPDLVTANTTDRTLAVYRNTTSSAGNITFGPATTFATGNGANYATIGDFDGDGKQDVIVSNYNSRTISVYHSQSTTGSINFDAAINLTTKSLPIGNAIVDLNGDGLPDIIQVGDGSTVSIFQNLRVVAPTVQASGVTFANTTNTSITISWTNGNGSARAVFVKAASSGSPSPVNSTTYTANTSFASRTQIGSTGWYCVYNGTGTTVPVTGLSSGTAYQVNVIEYSGTPGNELYAITTDTGNPIGFTTATAPPTLTSFTPASGPVGTIVTITGTNFNATKTNNIVFFGATMATVTATTTTSLTVTVPAGATYQPISVLNGATALTGYSATPFATTFTPSKGSITTVDISPKVALLGAVGLPV